MFRRKKPADSDISETGQQMLNEMRRQFDGSWESGKSSRPSNFPHGDPFEPDALIGPLFDVPVAAGMAGDEELFEFSWSLTLFLLATVAQIQTSEPSLRATNNIWFVRQGLLKYGYNAEERSLSALAMYIQRYHEESGAMERFLDSIQGKSEAELREMS